MPIVTFKQIETTTLYDYIGRHITWSIKTFGEGDHLEGLLNHIEKEIQEVRAEISPVERTKELVDIIILAIDAMWRQGFTSGEIVNMLLDKQNVNAQRNWPKITDPSKPTEHIRKNGYQTWEKE